MLLIGARSRLQSAGHLRVPGSIGCSQKSARRPRKALWKPTRILRSGVAALAAFSQGGEGLIARPAGHALAGERHPMRRAGARTGGYAAAHHPFESPNCPRLIVRMGRVEVPGLGSPWVPVRLAEVDRHVRHAVLVRFRRARQNLERERDDGGGGEEA